MVLAVMQAPAQNYTVTPVTEVPAWQVDLSYNQARPNWQEPASANFENWTLILVKIEDALKAYASNDDMMAVFVGSELRGLATPAVILGGTSTDASSFLLKLWGNEASDKPVRVTLKYYCSKLKNVFSYSGNYNMGEELGFEEDFVPPLSLASAKYPARFNIDVNAILAAEGITPAEGDMIGAFVGDDCRGVSPLPLSGDDSCLAAFAHEPGEYVTLKYYDATNGQMITFDTPIAVIWPGDVNGDGKVNISDIISIANYLLGAKPEVFSVEAADADGDGVVGSSDIVRITEMIMGIW